MIENRLAIIMAEQKMDCRDLVRITKLDNHTVRKLYKGTTTRIEINTLNALCYALQCNTNDIFRYKPD